MFTHTETPMTVLYQRQKHQIDMLVSAAKEVITADAEAETGDPGGDKRWDRAMGALAAAVSAVDTEDDNE